MTEWDSSRSANTKNNCHKALKQTRADVSFLSSCLPIMQSEMLIERMGDIMFYDARKCFAMRRAVGLLSLLLV